MTKKLDLETLTRKAIANERRELRRRVKYYTSLARKHKDPWYAEQAETCRMQAADPDLKAPFALPYRPRLQLFKGCNGNLQFDPVDCIGFSYDWYEIVKRIEGKVYLNAFDYSVTTSGHVSTLRSLLEQLGIPYREIEAPKGLQDLRASMEHHVSELAKARVRAKHARNPGNFKREIQRHMRALAMLEKIGHKAKPSDHSGAMDEWERSRSERLAYERKQSAYKRVKVIVDTDGSLKDKVGIHVLSGEAYIPHGSVYDLKQRAANAGYKYIYVHVEPHRLVTARLTESEMSVEVSEVSCEISAA
jgi:hypothetical protein